MFFLYDVRMIHFQNANFLTSSAKCTQFPEDEGIEVAFAGRSNAGKSSTINLLTNQKRLAKTSKTPGRTQLINFFTLDEMRRLVDLPGYGYAKVSASMRNEWAKLIDGYLSNRQCLRGVVLVMDIRHPLREFDLQMLEWAKQSGLRLHMLLNKADKFKRGEQNKTLFHVQKVIADYEGVSVQLLSTTKRIGVDELVSTLGEIYSD